MSHHASYILENDVLHIIFSFLIRRASTPNAVIVEEVLTFGNKEACVCFPGRCDLAAHWNQVWSPWPGISARASPEQDAAQTWAAEGAL